MLRAIALHRTPGFNFPGHFLDLSYDRVTRDGARLSLATGPHCADEDGQMNIGALALLADMALAATLRGAVGASARLATVSMSLQFSGAPRVGPIHADACFDGFVAGTSEHQGLTRVKVTSGRKVVCTGSGAFMVLGTSAPHPLPRRNSARSVEAPPIDHLNAVEEAVYRRAREALEGGGPFLSRFWGYAPVKRKGGAACTAPNGMHVGNRVGHAQGGVTFGMAALTAQAALPGRWKLVAASAWYVGPGTGASLHARSRIVHHGALTAVVRTRIVDEHKRGVLECVTSHAR